MIGFVPDSFNSLDEAGEGYAFEAGRNMGVQFFARRGEGRALERIDIDDADPASRVFGGGVLDVSVARSDLTKLKRFYREP